MDYTCDNCKHRHTWDCDDGYMTHKCEDFELDLDTIPEESAVIIRAMQKCFEKLGG